MKPYKITNMIIDEGFDAEETVSAYLTHENKDYMVTFNKQDLEILNTWMFEEESSVPTVLSETVVDSLREDVRKEI